MAKKTIKLSDYFEYRKHEYVTVQLIPSRSCKNNSTGSIALLVNKLFIQTNKLVKIENKKLILTPTQKVSYYIHMTKEDVQFFFIIPKVHITKFRAKFSEIWKNIEIKEVDSLLININNCTKYQLQYKNNDALSLDTDKRNNDLLHSNLSIIDILENNESVGILYNFIPTSNRENLYFQKTYSDGIKQYTEGNCVKKVKNIGDITLNTVKFIIQYIEDFLKHMQDENKKEELFLTFKKEISESTRRKGKTDICKSQTVILSKSNNQKREKELAIAMCNSYKIISNDNELIYKEFKKDIDIKKPVIFGAEINKTSINECQNFLSMPGSDILKQHKNIKHNKVKETKVPKCLENGEIRIGTVKCKENTQEAYYSTDKQFSKLGRVILGSMGSGKSHYLTNLAKDIIKADRGLIVIDYIDKCQLADSIKAITPKDRLLEIDCANIHQLQSFAYNELDTEEDIDDYKKVAIAMQKSEQLQTLLDSINSDAGKLTPRMMRFLHAAATIIFYLNKNASLSDIIYILENPYKRVELIENLSLEEKELLEDEINDLNSLNKYTSKNKLENYDSKIDGIIDRISWLKTNAYTKRAFKKDSSKNINFVDAINQKKVILIKIKEKDFKSKMIRNVIATFYLSKIWLAKQEGATAVKTELFFDEIHQSLNCQLLLEDILVEHRKFNLIPTLSMHYLGQCTLKCKNSILASGASFLLLSGCDVKAFDELKIQFEKNGYSESDLVELERYNALCLIKNEKENYSSFIAKLPK